MNRIEIRRFVPEYADGLPFPAAHGRLTKFEQTAGSTLAGRGDAVLLAAVDGPTVQREKLSAVVDAKPAGFSRKARNDAEVRIEGNGRRGVPIGIVEAVSAVETTEYEEPGCGEP